VAVPLSPRWLLPFAAAAVAATVSATPASAGLHAQPVAGGDVLLDAAGDALGARDIARVRPFRSTDGRLGVGFTLDANRLGEGHVLETLIDADRDPGTGDPSLGADAAVRVVGYGAELGRLAVAEWDAPSGAFVEAPVPPSAAVFQSGSRDVVWSMPGASLGVDPARPLRMAFAARGGSGAQAGLDRAPEAGAFTGRAGLQTGPWPAALPALRPTGPVAVGASFPPRRPARLTLPAYGLRPSPGRLHLRMAWRGGRGRVTWTLRIVVREDGGRVVKTVRGAGPAGERVVDRTVGVPARWRGRGARTRLEVVNGARIVQRQLLVRLR
jgi:hypothetical protein